MQAIITYPPEIGRLKLDQVIKTNQKQFSIIGMNISDEYGISKLDHTVREALDTLRIFEIQEPVVRVYRKGQTIHESFFSIPVLRAEKEALDEVARVILEDVPVLVGELVYISDASRPDYSRLAFVRTS